MNTSASNIPVTTGRNTTRLGSSGKSGVSSLPPSYHASYELGSVGGHFSCQSHLGHGSTHDYGFGQRNFSSMSCGGVFEGGGGHGRRKRAGSYPSGNSVVFLPFVHGDGPAGVGSAVIGGMGGDPAACGTIFSSTDGKMVMQNLNDRLASYIDKVRLLEVENAALESSISDFYSKEGLAGELKDYNHYYHQIKELNNQIICTTAENSQILLKIDNYCMHLEDMRQKFETEHSIHENVEADLKSLYPIFDELSSCKADLETKLETLQGELRALKTTREEKIICLKKRASDATMEVGTRPGPDLKKSLEEMRCKYEATIDTNRKEIAQWFEGKLDKAGQEFWSQEAEDGDRKATDLKCRLRAFEIDLQAQYSLRDTLQMSLAEVECRFHAQLAEIQDQVARTEQQLAELRLEMEGQDAEYKELLDVKNRLEQEIRTYRSLLEGGQLDHGRAAGSSHPSSAGRMGRTSPPTQGPSHRQ